MAFKGTINNIIQVLNLKKFSQCLDNYHLNNKKESWKEKQSSYVIISFEQLFWLEKQRNK